MMITPVFHKGRFLLWDIYVDGRWHGSRKTIEQCNAYRWQLSKRNAQ